MSFAKNVKSELSQIEVEKQCCIRAQSYGLLLFGRSFSPTSIRILTESEDVADCYSESILIYTGIEPNIVQTKSGKYSVKFESSDDRDLVINSYGHDPNDVLLRINRSNFDDDCCYNAFIRGAFLSCGTITDPNKNYHLEFIIQHSKLCSDFVTLMEDVNLSPKVSKRGNNYIIYFKDSEYVEDVLTFMGATQSSLDLMGIKMVKNMRNKINRRINFETANISRTVNASIVQIEAIKLIKEKNMFEKLSPQLQEIAQIRLENPDMSLDEIKDLLSDEISKSGVNHRLNRIVKFAEELK